MFQKVLCPTDLSDYAATLLACLPELKTDGLQQVVLLHVIDPSWLVVNGGLGFSLQGALSSEAKRALEQAEMDLASAGISARTLIEVGAPAKVILEVAEEQDVDLIVMGALGRSLLETFLIGGVAEKVIRTSRRPVLVQRFEVLRSLEKVECRRLCSRTFQKVLYPTDFSDPARSVGELLKRLRPVVDEVIVLHVQDERAMRHRSAEQVAHFDRVDRDRLEAIRSELSAAGIQTQVRLEHGLPAERIVAVAREENVGSIAIHSRGRSGATEFFLGSVAENVVRHAPSAVFVVPS